MVVALLVAVVGTAVHRSWWPFGVLVAIATVGTAGAMTRALSGYLGLASFGAIWLGLVLMFTYVRPGGDVIVVPDLRGYLWMFAPLVAIAVVSFLPARWFIDEKPVVTADNCANRPPE